MKTNTEPIAEELMVEIEIPCIHSKDFGGKEGDEILPIIFSEKVDDVETGRVQRFANVWRRYRDLREVGRAPAGAWLRLLEVSDPEVDGVLRLIYSPREKGSLT